MGPSADEILIKGLGNGYLSSSQGVPNHGENQALQHFLDEVDKATAIQNVVSRRWEQNTVADLKPFLSRVCRLEKQDAAVFLPQSSIDRAMGGSHRTNDRHEVAYFTTGLLKEEERHSRDTLFFPAIVAVPRNGKPKFRMEHPAVDLLDPEVVFLGELHVRYHVGLRSSQHFKTTNASYFCHRYRSCLRDTWAIATRPKRNGQVRSAPRPAFDLIVLTRRLYRRLSR